MTNIKTIKLDNEIIEYTIRRSNRAKRPRITSSPRDGLVVVIPKRFALKHVNSLLRDNAKWILRQNKLIAVKRETIPQRKYIDGEMFPVIGKEYPLYIKNWEGDVYNMSFDGSCFEISCPENYDINEAMGKQLFEDIYRKIARHNFNERTSYFADLMQVSYGRIAIRDQKTKWGSCSNLGNLNFNYRLIMAPPEIIDYIIVHELAHLIELNHSPAFYEILSAVIPDYKKRQKWLKSNGAKLIL